MEYRIGIGYDIHRLVEGRKLFIGGLEIPYIKGLLGHSDGDVLLHAICDALLGAISGLDLGEMFPDSDTKYQGICSSELLKQVNTLVIQKNYRISNLDTVLIAQEPMFSPFKKQIRETIARVIDIKEDCINIKAKTNEGLDEIGRGNAIAAYAVAIITRRQ